MFKVLIVDDEAFIREGLTTAIDWNLLGCTVAGEAKNGIEAVQAIEEMKPEIIMMDIKMPGKTGLEVSEYALSINPKTKVILLSGYNEFEYARQALQLGAYDYILKPTVYEEVIGAVRRAVEDLVNDERRQTEIAKFKEELNRNIDFYRKAFLQKLIYTPEKQSLKKINVGEMMPLYKIADTAFRFVAVRVEDFALAKHAKSAEEKQLFSMALEYQIESFFELEHGIYMVPLKEQHCYALVWTLENCGSEDEIASRCEQLQKRLKEDYLKITVSIGISGLKESILQLNKAYKEAMESLEHVLYLGNDAIIFYSDLFEAEMVQEPTQMIEIEEYCMSVTQAVKLGDEEKCRNALSQLFELFESSQYKPETVRSICVEWITQLIAGLKHGDVEWPAASREQLYSKIINVSSKESLYRLLNEFLTELTSEIFKRMQRNYKNIVGRVIDLIETHYSENITLGWIAEKVHFNSSYLSRLIKNECNETFTDLLTKYRMEKAKEMLKDPDMKMYEISESVGFSDPHYFSNKFKKIMGVTPTEYRDTMNALF